MVYDIKQISTALEELHNSNDVSDAAYSTLKYAIEQLNTPTYEDASDFKFEILEEGEWVEIPFHKEQKQPIKQ